MKGFSDVKLQSWKTGEVAKIVNVSKRTLQNWIDAEKIPRPDKTTNGYYAWSPDDVQAARVHLQLLKSTTHYRVTGHDK